MKVYIANLDSIGKISDTKLSDDEILQYNKFSNQTRRNQYLMAHAIIFDKTCEHPISDKNGKLHLQNGFVSVAHKDNWVVVALSGQNVGIDIENASIKRDFISESELLGIKPTNDAEFFYKNFTQYESDVKYGDESENANHLFYKLGNYMICVCTNDSNVEFICVDCNVQILPL